MSKVISSVYPLDSALDSKTNRNSFEEPEESWRSPVDPDQPELIVNGGVRSPLQMVIPASLTTLRSSEPGADKSIRSILIVSAVPFVKVHHASCPDCENPVSVMLEQLVTGVSVGVGVGVPVAVLVGVAVGVKVGVGVDVGAGSR